jgi:transposase
MRRHELTDDQWAKIEKLLRRGPGRPSKDGDRNFLNAIIYMAKTGIQWRDMPDRFGKWKTIYNRFKRWAKRCVWRDIFRAAAVTDEDVASILDASVIRAHQDASGGPGGPKKMKLAVLEAVSRRRFTRSSI